MGPCPTVVARRDRARAAKAAPTPTTVRTPPRRPRGPVPGTAVAKKSSPCPSSSGSRAADARGSAPGDGPKRIWICTKEEPSPGSSICADAACRTGTAALPRGEELMCDLLPCSTGEKLLCAAGFMDWAHSSAAERGREDFTMLQMNFCEVSTTRCCSNDVMFQQ